MSYHHRGYGRDHRGGGQHSFWAGVLGFFVVPAVGGIVSRLVSSQTDTVDTQYVKAALPHAALALGSYLMMERDPKNHSFFLGATIGESLSTVAAPATVAVAKAMTTQAQTAAGQAITTQGLTPATINAMAKTQAPTTSTGKLEALVAKALNGTWGK